MNSEKHTQLGITVLDKLKTITLSDIFMLIIMGDTIAFGLSWATVIVSSIFIIATYTYKYFIHRKELRPTEIDALRAEMDKLKTQMAAMQLRAGFEGLLP